MIVRNLSSCLPKDTLESLKWILLKRFPISLMRGRSGASRTSPSITVGFVNK